MSIVIRCTLALAGRIMYSLSHVAVAVSPSDSLYGREPDEKNRYGISLGTISLRGETGTLSVGLETLMRVTSNLFLSVDAGAASMSISPAASRRRWRPA